MSARVDDDLWSAVGDPTRRRLLDLLLAGDAGTATSLSEHDLDEVVEAARACAARISERIIGVGAIG